MIKIKPLFAQLTFHHPRTSQVVSSNMSSSFFFSLVLFTIDSNEKFSDVTFFILIIHAYQTQSSSHFLFYSKVCMFFDINIETDSSEGIINTSNGKRLDVVSIIVNRFLSFCVYGIASRLFSCLCVRRERKERKETQARLSFE